MDLQTLKTCLFLSADNLDELLNPASPIQCDPLYVECVKALFLRTLNGMQHREVDERGLRIGAQLSPVIIASAVDPASLGAPLLQR